MQYEAILPCLGAAVVADRTCAAWGTHHTDYHLGIFSPGQGLASFDWLVCGQVLVAGAAFGLAALLFAELNHGLGACRNTDFRRTDNDSQHLEFEPFSISRPPFIRRSWCFCLCLRFAELPRAWSPPTAE
jgi:hypothetical protein